MRLHCVCWTLLLTLVAGCASSTGQRERVWPYPEPPVVSAPAPGSPRYPSDPLPGVPSPLGTPTPVLPDKPSAPVHPRMAEEISGQAVISLLRQAREARAAGNLDGASATLERALRIEPRNYFLWSALAGVYLDKGDYGQAESVASRSNSLARGNVYVELENWKTIQRARDASGDAVGGLQAAARVEQIERGLAANTPQ